MSPVRPAISTLKRSLTLHRSTVLLLLVLPTFGCSRGGGGAATEIKLTPADTAGFLKTSVSGNHGGTFMGATPNDPKTFNILISKETSSSYAIGLMFDSLVTRNAETLQIEPALAESYQHSADGRTWTFKLRPGLKWSDGQPLTADDITFTLDLIYDPKIETALREILLIDRKPWRYKKLDDGTVQIDLPTPFGPFLDVASAVNILPKHKLEAAWKAGKFNSTWGVDTPPVELVGTGPWLLQKYAPGQTLHYRRNPYYWKLAADGQSLPFIDNSVTQIVPDLNAVILRFKSRETDFTSLRPEDWTEMKKGEATGGHRAMDLGPTWSVTYLSFNQNPRAQKLPAYKRDWFSKKEFRQAISYALNRKSVIDTVYRGLGRPLWSPVSEANKAFYNPKVRQYPYDAAKASALLTGLGFTRKNSDGILEDAAGHPLEFNLLSATGNNVGTAMCNIIVDDLKKLGVKVSFTPVEFNSLVTRLERTYDWEAVVLGFTAGPEPHLGKSIWTTPGMLHIWDPRQSSPATLWEAEIDQIFSQAAKSVNTPRRKALYNRWQEIASDQLPLIFLVTPDALIAIRNRLQNTKPTSLSPLWNRDEIYIQP
jgi:peptide/nickel transport system substrate-binding protein